MGCLRWIKVAVIFLFAVALIDSSAMAMIPADFRQGYDLALFVVSALLAGWIAYAAF